MVKNEYGRCAANGGRVLRFFGFQGLDLLGACGCACSCMAEALGLLEAATLM